MIKLVISPEYFGNNDSKSSIRAQLKGLGAYNIEIDEATGFVTAVMTLENYEKFVDNLRKRIENTADEIVNKYDEVKSITYNGDYTVFNIVISGLNKRKIKSVVFELLMVSATYQVISGIPQNETSIRVNFYNKDNKLVEVMDTVGNKEE